MSDVPYWQKPEWPEQLEKNIATIADQWQHDWGAFFRGIAARAGITLDQAILLHICLKVHSWTEASMASMKSLHPVVEHMKKEITDDGWKADDAE